METARSGSSSSPSPDSFARPIQVTKNVSREVMDPSEDSGLSSISHSSENSHVSSSGASDKTAEVKSESTIGEGIAFVDPKVIEQEKQEVEAEKLLRKKAVSAAKEEQRRAKEAYEQEVQEKQYKCLMHLLTQSKAMSSFLNDKVSLAISKDGKKTTPNKRAGAKRKMTPVKKAEPPKKRGRTSKTEVKKMNLSEDDISKELANMSDEEEKKENAKAIAEYIKPKYFVGELRDYQKVGLNWLRALYDHGLNGILADEMGLGKTIQIIALFAYLFEKRVPGPYMIIVPLSTLPNWISEFERFAPKLPLVVYYGNKEARSKLKQDVSKKVRVDNFLTHPVVLMTYEMPTYDSRFLSQFNWRYIVVDEAQRIKNFNCQLFRILKTFKSVNRVLMTGTPLQNNLSELWSLLNYLLPEVFNDLNVFEAWFDAKDVQSTEGQKKFFKQEQEKQVMSALREILKPFMLRRLKEDVCPDIPPIKEVIVYAPMTDVQYNLYSAILKRDFDKLNRRDPVPIIVDVDGVRPKRKCTQNFDLSKFFAKPSTSGSENSLEEFSLSAAHAKLNKEAIARDLSEWTKFADINRENVDYFIRLRFSNPLAMYRHAVNHPYLIHRPLNDCGIPFADESIVKMSGKLLVIDAMLKKLKASGHKILFFTNFSMILDIMEDYLELRQYDYVRLDGSVKVDERKTNIDRFQTDPEVFLFLLTTKAGAVGLNLAAADTVIIYDSDWNPQNDLQAMARCHRIGQSRPVVVYRLCTKGTIDEEIIKRANAKRFLEKAVISKDGNIVKSAEGLVKLKLMLDENMYKIVDAKNEVYTDAELEDLLDRSDMVRVKEEKE